MEISGQGLFEKSHARKELKKTDPARMLKNKDKIKRKKSCGDSQKLSDLMIKKIKVENGVETILKKKKLQQKKNSLTDGDFPKVKQKESGDADIDIADMKPKLKKKKKKLLMKGGPLTSAVAISDSSGGVSINTGAVPSGGVSPNTGTPTSTAEDGVERGRRLKDRKPHMKKERKMKEEQVMVDDSDDNDEEDCSADKCLRPTGEAVNWVQCDRCELWFHLLCVGLKKDEILDDEDYVCTTCRDGHEGAVAGSPTDPTQCGLPLRTDRIKRELKESFKLSPPCSPGVKAAADKAISDVVKAVAESSRERRREAEKRVEAVESMMQLERGGAALDSSLPLPTFSSMQLNMLAQASTLGDDVDAIKSSQSGNAAPDIDEMEDEEENEGDVSISKEEELIMNVSDESEEKADDKDEEVYDIDEDAEDEYGDELEDGEDDVDDVEDDHKIDAEKMEECEGSALDDSSDAFEAVSSDLEELKGYTKKLLVSAEQECAEVLGSLTYKEAQVAVAAETAAHCGELESAVANSS